MNTEFAANLLNISKSYGDQFIFKDLNLEIHNGSFSVIMGKNGAGKSTLLRLIAGLEDCKLGKINVLGLDLEDESLSRRQSLAYISENIALDSRYVLSSAVDVCKQLYSTWDQYVFDKFAACFGLTLNKRFGNLSRGQKVQFLFAIAAASRPKLFLLDEVTSVLDANARFEVMSHLKEEASKGATVLLATNIAAEAHNFANEIILLTNGAIGLKCSVDDLQQRFFKIRIHSDFLNVKQIPKEARPVQVNRDGSISYLLPRVDSFSKISFGTSDLRGVTIEDVFVYFTGPENEK